MIFNMADTNDDNSPSYYRGMTTIALVIVLIGAVFAFIGIYYAKKAAHDPQPISYTFTCGNHPCSSFGNNYENDQNNAEYIEDSNNANGSFFLSFLFIIPGFLMAFIYAEK
jgi:hypothetical protein